MYSRHTVAPFPPSFNIQTKIKSNSWTEEKKRKRRSQKRRRAEEEKEKKRKRRRRGRRERKGKRKEEKNVKVGKLKSDFSFFSSTKWLLVGFEDCLLTKSEPINDYDNLHR